MTDVDDLIQRALSLVKSRIARDSSSSSEDEEEVETQKYVTTSGGRTPEADCGSSSQSTSNAKTKSKTSAQSVSLSSSLQHNIADPNGGMYIDKYGNAKMSEKYLHSLAEEEQKKAAVKSCAELARETVGVRQAKKERRLERSKTKGSNWFNMPAPAVLTEDMKNDLTVLQMRKVLDPKRFYKGPDIRGALPKYFQMGRVVETAADFYSGRIPKKQRKRTLVDELLDDAEFRRYNKRKYEEIQAKQPRTYNKAYKKMKKLKKHKNKKNSK